MRGGAAKCNTMRDGAGPGSPVTWTGAAHALTLNSHSVKSIAAALPMTPDTLNLLTHGLTGASPTVLVVSFVLAAQLTVLSVTLYLHRSQAHRGVDFHPAVSHVFRFWAWLSTAMVTKEWVAIHRKHHARCETEEDPHSPAVHGMAKVAIHGVVLYQQASKDRAMIEQYGVGTPDDWLERNVYSRKPIAGPTLYLFVSLAAFGAIGITWWALMMLVIPVCAAGVINGLGHGLGYRNFETADRSTNLTPWAFVLGGEELHNNHHAFPSSARFALRRFEFDIGWAVLRLLRFLGLATILRVAPRLEQRPQVSMPDAETVKALLAHRFSVMTTYFKSVTVPVLKAEAAAAGARMDARVAKLSRRLRKALANDGRWLDAENRETLARWVSERPMLATVVEYRRRLAAVLERSGKSTDELVAALKEWCRDAESSGIEALRRYAEQLRGYALAPA